jgi:predicted sulfurtransferase
VVGAVVTTVLASLVGLSVNAVRPDGLPLVAAAPYQTLVPCPEPGGPVEAIAPDDPLLHSDRTFVVDARPAAEYRTGHLSGAVNLPYDWLDPVADQDLRALAEAIARSGATRVAVYGDGGRPDSGEHLGREISGRGIKNVFFITGGAPAVLPEAHR